MVSRKGSSSPAGLPAAVAWHAGATLRRQAASTAACAAWSRRAANDAVGHATAGFSPPSAATRRRTPIATHGR
jgi:hypothetical protein